MSARGPEAHPEADLDLLRGELDGCRAEIGRLREREERWKRLVRGVLYGAYEVIHDDPPRLVAVASSSERGDLHEYRVAIPDALAALLAEALGEDQ